MNTPRLHQLVALVVVAMLALSGTAITTSSAGAAAPTVSCLPNCFVQDEANWILLHQNASGLVAMGIPDGHTQMLVQSYDAGYAVLGLADAYGETANPVDAAGAWKWLSWYRAQMAAGAPSGPAISTCLSKDVVYLEGPKSTLSCWYVPDMCLGLSRTTVVSPFPSDHTKTCVGTGNPNVPVPIIQTYKGSTRTHPYLDATDASAAMFLVALWRTYQVTHDTARLIAVEGSTGPAGGAVGEAVAAIHSTFDAADGLTYASAWWPPSWPYPHKYLEDEAEVAAGLSAAANLESVLVATHHGSSQVGAQAGAMSTAITHAVNATWWQPSGAHPSYAWAKDQKGALAKTNWSASAFADPQENLWAVLWNLAPIDRATSVTTTFTAIDGPRVNHRLWLPNLARSAIFPQPLYWAALAEAKIGQIGVARSAVDLLDQEYLSRKWQFQPRDAGLAIWVSTLVD